MVEIGRFMQNLNGLFTKKKVTLSDHKDTFKRGTIVHQISENSKACLYLRKLKLTKGKRVILKLSLERVLT